MREQSVEPSPPADYRPLPVVDRRVVFSLRFALLFLVFVGAVAHLAYAMHDRAWRPVLAWPSNAMPPRLPHQLGFLPGGSALVVRQKTAATPGQPNTDATNAFVLDLNTRQKRDAKDEELSLLQAGLNLGGSDAPDRQVARHPSPDGKRHLECLLSPRSATSRSGQQASPWTCSFAVAGSGYEAALIPPEFELLLRYIRTDSMSPPMDCTGPPNAAWSHDGRMVAVDTGYGIYVWRRVRAEGPYGFVAMPTFWLALLLAVYGAWHWIRSGRATSEAARP